MASVPMVSAKTVSNDSRSDQMYSTLSTDPDAVQSSDDDDSVDVDNSTETPSPTADSPRHRRYLYPKKEFVDKLRPEEIRWFHRSENAKKWAAFIGYDSLRIECRYRALEVDSNGDLDANERILVLGGLYEVDVVKKKCFPVYWSGEKRVMCVCVKILQLLQTTSPTNTTKNYLICYSHTPVHLM